jgi:hypothetical protein
VPDGTFDEHVALYVNQLPRMMVGAHAATHVKEKAAGAEVADVAATTRYGAKAACAALALETATGIAALAADAPKVGKWARAVAEGGGDAFSLAGMWKVE